MLITENSTSSWITDIWNSTITLNNSTLCGRLTISDLFNLTGPQMQHHLTSLMDDKISTSFHNDSFSNTSDKARKLSVKCSESSGFLRATPNSNVTLMSNDEWITSIRLRLGLYLHFIPFRCRCVCANHPMVDRLGHHFFSCKHGGERFKTHNDICSHIFTLGRSAGLSGSLEPLLNHASSSRRGDFLFHNPDVSSLSFFRDSPPTSDVIGDVKVSFPCAKSYLDKGSHSKEGYTASDAYIKKASKYKSNDLDLLQGRNFIPISIESFGRFHPTVKPFISALCAKAATISGVSKSILCNYWINRISDILQKNIARMLISRVDRIVSATMPLKSSNPNYIVPSHDDLRHPRIAPFHP